jgi:glycosyltransferase involved in cell wall biosynthesis
MGLRDLVISVWGSDVIYYGPPPEPSLAVFYKRYALRQAKAVTASSHFLAGECEKYLGPRDRVRVVPFGVDTDYFAPRPARSPREEVVIGFVKHLEPYYGVEDLVVAFEEVVTRYPDARLIIAGDGSLRSSLRQKVHSKGLGELVEFLGQIPQHAVRDVLAQCDVFAMPSLREALGVAAIEALAMGVPVVATQVGGIPEIVKDGITGLLVPAMSPDALAEALLYLVEDEALRRQMGREGRQDVLERYRWAGCVDKMLDIYDDVVSGSW